MTLLKTLPRPEESNRVQRARAERQHHDQAIPEPGSVRGVLDGPLTGWPPFTG